MAAPTGLRPGPWRTLFPGAPIVSQVFIFPAPVLVINAVRKRKHIQRRIKTTSFFIKPVEQTVVVVVSSFPEALAVVRQEFSRKARTKTTSKFTKVFGRPTAVTKPREIQVFSQTVQRSKIRPGVKSILRPPVKATAVVIIVAFPEAIAVVSQALNHSFLLREVKTKSSLRKPFGRPTTKTKVRPIKVLGFAAKQAMILKRRAPVQVILGEVPRTFTGAPCATVITFDALWVADGLSYHKGLSRPTITMTPCPAGGFDVVVTGSLSDMRPDLLSKETVTIDGDLP